MARGSSKGAWTGPTWASYRESIGDRSGLFAEICRVWAPRRALYPGSYLDLSPSTAIASVTYVDNDRKAMRYFENDERAHEELKGRTLPGAAAEVRLVPGDFTEPLPVPEAAFDLIILLFTGPAWDHCRRYLSPGGLLLANASHGDASLAALDPNLDLVAAVHHRGEKYQLDTTDLDRYLVPKKPQDADADLIRSRGRGIAYTRPAFAYLFQARTPTR